MELIKPREINPLIPSKYRKYAGFYPYMIPIFGKMYFGRIKNIIELFTKSNKNFPKVLEVGGGFGVFSSNFKLNFPKSEVHIVDLYPEDIMRVVKNIMTTKFGIELKYLFGCDIQKKTQYRDQSFDLIFALDMLEHVPDANKALDELIRLLRRGGYLFISVPTEVKLLKLIRMIYNKIIPINVNPHWNGLIKSEKEFFNCFKKKQIKIKWCQKYPFKSFPKMFSYDIFYIIQKDFE